MSILLLPTVAARRKVLLIEEVPLCTALDFR